ncbi:protein MMS22-like [Chironomus tepperi]|uniref:protein MMS22-like n=1 Tax=Chironomus tepperi TaxID=113505 RepID=UPI00391F9D2E
MDEDIFAFDSQYQELLNEDLAVEDQPSIIGDSCQSKTSIDLFSIYFNCHGETSSDDFEENVFKKDLENLFNYEAMDLNIDEIELFEFDFDTEFSNYDILIQMARTNIQQIAMSSLDCVDQQFQKTFNSLRNDVTKLMLLLRCNYQNLNDNQLRTIRTILGTYDSMSNFSMIHLSFSKDGNVSTSSNYHLLHLMLECRWIYLTMIYKLDCVKGQIGSDDSELYCELKLLMFDLIMLSVSKFQKSNSANLVFTSPFICSCVRDMWKLLHLFMAKLSDQNLEFWSTLSSVIDEIGTGKSFYERFSSKKILLRNSQFIACKNHDQFAIWIVSGIAKLINQDQVASNKSSYEYLENLIGKYLKSDQSEENMRVLLVMISEVILNVWQPKSEILMTLWEYYQRKINSPFLIAGQNPNSMAVSNTTVTAYLEQIKAQQNTAVSKLNVNLNSFNMFVYILGKMVQRFTDDGQKVQVLKIFGRIYTKFPPNKLQQLNEMGIHNFMRLLISLSISTNLNDVGQKITDTMLQIPMEKLNHQVQIMKGHMVMLILFSENRMNICNYLTKIMNQVNSILQKTNSATSILKILSESLSLILLKNLDENEEILENGEDLLIDSWIIKYFQNSVPAEQDRLYESLNKIIKKIYELQNNPIVMTKVTALKEKLFNILLPYIKQVFGKIESVWLPEMVANLCLLTSSSAATSNIPSFSTLFKTFIDTNSTNLDQGIKFLTIILKNSDNKERLDAVLIIQNWIKYSVLLSGTNSDLKELTSQIVSMKEFKFLCETSTIKTEEFLNSKERLCSFIGDIGRKYSTSSNQQKFQLIEKVHDYLSTFEKWSLPYLQQQQQTATTQKPAPNVQVDESIMRIYSFIAITFLHCSELIYVRSKSSCFFNVAVAHFVLPSTLMVGQNLPRAIIVSMHRIWPLLIEGISRLNYKCDQHVTKVLNDVIVKWAPLMKISNNSKFVAKPFISITNFKNFEIIELFWGKMSKNFIALQPGRKSNINCCLILTVFEEVMHVIEAEETRLVAVWKNSIQQIVECAMLLDDIEPANKSAFGLIERFIRNKNFAGSNVMKELLVNNLKSITESSLSYHSGLYFRYLTKLSKVNLNIVNNFMPHLLTQIQKVEQLRGSGRDVKLRNLYEQLQSSCKKV